MLVIQFLYPDNQPSNISTLPLYIASQNVIPNPPGSSVEIDGDPPFAQKTER